MAAETVVIRTHQESWCLPYAGFFIVLFAFQKYASEKYKSLTGTELGKLQKKATQLNSYMLLSYQVTKLLSYQVTK